MSGWSDEREQGLRQSGWSDDAIADYKVGYEQALTAMKAAPVQRPAAEGRGWFPVGEHYPRNSERGVWERESFAGQLSRVLPAPDDAAELAEARRLQDDREYRYGNRLDLQTCLMAVRHNGPRSLTVSGTTGEVCQVLQSAGIPVVVAQEYAPPALAGGQAQVTRV